MLDEILLSLGVAQLLNVTPGAWLANAHHAAETSP